MPRQVKRGTVILRRWDDKSGLTEESRNFETLDELFTLCLEMRFPLLVDRVILEGDDGRGIPNAVSLVFQSMTVTGRETDF